MRAAPLISFAFAGCFLLGAGCDAPGQGQGVEIGSAVQLLSSARGDLAEQALRRLLLHGRDALPYFEAALHGATPAGRRNLVIGLRRIGLSESAPLLGHIAAFDADRATAREAWQTLNLWASERSERGLAARTALRKVDEVRGTEAAAL